MSHRLFSLAPRALACAATLAGALLGTSALAAPGRLPTGVKPVHYAITIEPDVAGRRFSGEEEITIDVTTPTRSITINAADLSLSRATIDGAPASGITLDAAAQTATLTFSRPITNGQHRLAITYSGLINESPIGLFSVDYTNDDGTADKMVVTQFEAPDARRFAPMWDEPGIKATFTLSAVTPADQNAFSNMPVASKTPAPGGKTLWRFGQSPKMSSYLLFFGMGHVDRRTVQEGNVEIGVITRKGVSDQGAYALESARRVIRAYTDYFGVPYPLPKLDMIAVPSSSQTFSAMENWGAIMYFEPVLLIDPRTETELQRQYVFRVVAHEIAHQWFGNLVTMAWWDDLWLNEGFASWLESKATNDLNPGWLARASQMAGPRQSVMRSDALGTTHPIIQSIATTDQIAQAFDGITYVKGELVIGMLESTVGPENFRAGVRAYMRKYAYQNTVTNQLWAEISAASGRPVEPMMDGFTKQGGVPLLVVGEMQCDGADATVPLSQRRFALDAQSRTPQQWALPVPYAAPASANAADAPTSSAGTDVLSVASPQGIQSVMLTQPQTVRVAGGCGGVIANAGLGGYYRVLYAPALQKRLSDQFGKLALIDQIGLLGDAYALASSGDQGIDAYFALVDQMTPDSSPVLWQQVIGQLMSMDVFLNDTPTQALLHRRANTLLTPLFAHIGWQAQAGETPPVAVLRDGLISAMGHFGNSAVVAEARRWVERQWAGEAVPSDVIVSARGVFAENATTADWDAILAHARSEKSPILRQTLYEMLGQARDEKLVSKTFDLVASTEVDKPLRAKILEEVAANHPRIAFDYGARNAAMVNDLIEVGARTQYIPKLAVGGNDETLAKAVLDYAARAIPADAQASAQEVARLITFRVSQRNRLEPGIARWSAR